ncbi:hypothetical protein JCM11251_002693 [Rhodosporidiobolus azoricus]
MSSTLSDLASATASALESAASSTASDAAHSSGSRPSSYKVIGIVLAVTSGLLIGGSFIFKKMGLMRARAKSKNAVGEGLPYLKSWLWWLGMIIMIIGEVCNVVAYSFADAILVTPMGSIAVVTSGVLAHFLLKERLTSFGWIGTALCVLGSIIIALNGPSTHTSAEIGEFKKLFIAPGFLVWLGIAVAASVGLVFWVAPRYGKTHMLVYIGICSLLGGLSVACTSGLGGSILSAIRGESSPWGNWFFWFLLIFCVVTLLLEVFYLNKALEIFNTAMVTPVYFVIFTTCTLVTSIILNKGFAGSTVTQIVTLVLGFLVICFGITLLQLSKIDPEEIKEGVLDRRSTILLSASRAEAGDARSEKSTALEEDPGIDTIRGTAGVIGSVRRAISMRRSMSAMSMGGSFDPNEMNMRRRGRNGAPGALGSGPSEMEMGMRNDQGGVRRYQLYDEPMPADASDKISLHSSLASPSFPARERSSAIKFAGTDNVHRYDTAAPGSSASSQHQHLEQPRIEGSHEHRDITSPGFPPLSASNRPTSPLAQQQSEGFSAARSGSLFSTSQYLDPYSDDPSGPASGNDFSPALVSSPSFSSSSPSAQTFPRRQDSGGLSADGRSRSLASRLSSALAGPNPDVASLDFAAGDAEHGVAGGTKSPPPSSTRGRFAIPGLSTRSDSGHNHRVPHPKGPEDLEAQESQALVGGMDSPTRGSGRRGSTSSEGEDEADVGTLGGRLETYDSRDVL